MPLSFKQGKAALRKTGRAALPFNFCGEVGKGKPEKLLLIYLLKHPLRVPVRNWNFVPPGEEVIDERRFAASNIDD